MTENDRTDEQPQEPASAEAEATDETRELPPADAEAATNEGNRSKLTRLRSEGMLAGVAAGLGRHFNVDPVIFRIGFGVSLFFGGFGALAYLALALFLPDESGKTPVKSSRLALGAAIVLIGLFLIPAIGWGFWDGGAGWHGWGALWLIIPAAIAIGAYAIVRDRGESASAGSVLAAVFIAGAAVVGFFVLMLLAALAAGFGQGTLIAVLVIVSGLLVALGAFTGGLRWLIVPALALATGVGVAAAADFELEGDIGQRHHVPLTVGEIPEDGYELAMGELGVDLRELEWKPKTVVELDASLGMGELIIAVPEDVCVQSEASASGGSIQVAGDRQNGIEVAIEELPDREATLRAVIDAELQFGDLQIINDDDFEFDGDRIRFAGEKAAAQRAALERACSG